MKNLVIAGAGGFGRELNQWVKDINRASNIGPVWRVRGFIDDNMDALKGVACDLEVVETIRDYQPRENEEVALAIANPSTKEKVVTELKARGAVFATIIHSSAKIGDFCTYGEGLVMYPDSGITVNVTIGDYVTILSAGIGHDVVVGDYCTISSYCELMGGVWLGKRVYLGSHSSVIPGRRLGDDTYVAAGSMVMTNQHCGARVMGNPAKKMVF